MLSQFKNGSESLEPKNSQLKRGTALYDILLSKSDGSKYSALKVVNKSHELHSNAARYLEVLTPKHFVYKNKKKKKLSVLKKKILLVEFALLHIVYFI